MLFKGVVTIICVLLLSQLVIAECFTYKNSNFYCQDLSLEISRQECSFYPDCNLSTDLLPYSCQEVADCHEVVCKSSCQREKLGLCPAGSWPNNEPAASCLPGCCQFVSSQGQYCQPQNTRYACEIEASNKGISVYNYSVGECYCQSELKISLPVIVPLSEREKFSPVANNQTRDLSLHADTVGKSGWWWILLSLIVLAAAVYYLFSKNIFVYQRSNKKYPSILKKNLLEDNFFRDNFDSRTELKLDSLRKRSQQKRHKFEIEQFLTESNLAVNLPKKDWFSQLNSVTLRQAKKKQKIIKGRSRQLINIFQRLQKLVPPIREQPVIKPKPLPEANKSNTEKIINNLRGLAKNK